MIRIATISDIPELQIVRNSVKENKLSSPNRIKDADVEEYLLSQGKGWVTFVDGKIIGFAIADLIGHSIWALFYFRNMKDVDMGDNFTKPCWIGIFQKVGRSFG